MVNGQHRNAPQSVLVEAAGLLGNDYYLRIGIFIRFQQFCNSSLCRIFFESLIRAGVALVLRNSRLVWQRSMEIFGRVFLINIQCHFLYWKFSQKFSLLQVKLLQFCRLIAWKMSPSPLLLAWSSGVLEKDFFRLINIEFLLTGLSYSKATWYSIWCTSAASERRPIRATSQKKRSSQLPSSFSPSWRCFSWNCASMTFRKFVSDSSISSLEVSPRWRCGKGPFTWPGPCGPGPDGNCWFGNCWFGGSGCCKAGLQKVNKFHNLRVNREKNNFAL